MSDPAINLDWIGRTLRAIQAEQRTIRTEVDALRTEVGGLRASLLPAVADVVRAGEGRIMDRFAAFEARMDTRLDRLATQLGQPPQD